jgi:transcriptional regulator with XRE-family HTH domain
VGSALRIYSPGRVLAQELWVTTLRRWSGAEARALREAKRMSIREFAAHLGVSDRMISKGEAGADRIQPRPVNQAALDTSLAQSSADVQARFTLLVAGSTTPTSVIEPNGHPETAAASAPTASTTCAETSGSGAPPRPIPANTNSKAAPSLVPSTGPHRRRSTTHQPTCTTTTPASDV